MQSMYLIGWLIGTAFITVIPYWQKQRQDGRKFDIAYILPVFVSGAIAGVAGLNGRVIESADPIMEFVGGFIVAVGVQKTIAVGVKPKKKVTDG